MWSYAFVIITYKGHYDDPAFLGNQLIMTGLLSAVLLPRSVISLGHFTGKLIRIKQGGHIIWLTGSAMIFSLILMLILAHGAFRGRFNFKTEKIEIRIKGLNSSLDGIKIAQLSDLHLSSFYKKADRLEKAISIINSHNPDLIFNTGDFVTIGRREFDRFDTILIKHKSRFGNYAVLGNHDMGTYLPDKAREEKRLTPEIMGRLIIGSGYRLLNDENEIIKISNAEVAVIGVKTSGSHPGIVHGDLKKALIGTDSADLRILLCHDPNQWDLDVAGKTDIELSLAGHTHGMQVGIITRNFRWSPARRYYPRWNGLYSEGDQYLYVNRGLGLLGVPFRIWMPPEITIITLRSI